MALAENRNRNRLKPVFPQNEPKPTDFGQWETVTTLDRCSGVRDYSHIHDWHERTIGCRPTNQWAM